MKMMVTKQIIKLLIILLMSSATVTIYSQEARSNKVAFNLNNLPDSIPPTIKILSPDLKGDMSYQSKVELINITQCSEKKTSSSGRLMSDEWLVMLQMIFSKFVN